VGEIVVEGKTLVGVCRSDPARDVDFAVGHIIPQAAAGFCQRFISGFGGDVCYPCHQVTGTYCMSDDLLLLPDGHIRLTVAISLRPELRRVFPTFSCFDVEVMRLLPTLVN